MKSTQFHMSLSYHQVLVVQNFVVQNFATQVRHESRAPCSRGWSSFFAILSAVAAHLPEMGSSSRCASSAATTRSSYDGCCARNSPAKTRRTCRTTTTASHESFDLE